MEAYSDLSRYFWRTRAKLSAVVALTVALSYGGGLWLQVLHGAVGAVERNEPPPVVHWLRDSMLMMPLMFVAVWASILLARRALATLGRGASRFMSGAAVASVIAVVTSAVLAAASPIHHAVFQAHHHAGGEEMPLLAHMWLEGLLALVANLAITAVVYLMLGRRLWTARLPQPARPAWAPVFARRLLALGQIGLLLLSILGGSLNTPVTAAPAVGAANGPCPAGAPVKTFDVSAIDVKMWLNRFGDSDPQAQMLALNSMIPAVRAQEAAGPSSLSIGLRDDPIQPLAIRANQGDCVIINFTNATTRPAPGATGNNYGLHIDGLAFQISSSGDGIGNNPLSSVPAGGTITYTYWIPNDPTLEGAHYIHPGPGNRQAVAHGLFGTLSVEPPGSTYRNPTTGQPQLSGWEADIIPASGKAFRENVKVFHEIGNESERDVPVDIDGEPLPTVDPHTQAYRPGSRAINYRSEPFMDRLDFAEDQKAVVYGAYTFGDTSNIIPRGYLGDPTKFRLVHGGSEVFHVYHLHGGSIRWRFNPKADPTYDYAKTGLDKHPVEIQSQSARLDSQSIGPGESFDLEIENGAGGAQQGAGEFLFHCHIAHHYFSGMWSYWRVYDTLQPDLMPLPDRAPLPRAVDSSALIGKTINGQTITAANLEAWIRPQLPPQGVTRAINPATRDTADQDASVWDWAIDPSTGLYLGEPDRLTPNWPNYANVVPGHPMALMVDQTVQSTYLLNGSPVMFNSGGYIGNRPKILFNPTNGRPAWPLLRPHIGKRPPFSPNGHSGAPYLGEYGGAPPDPALSIDPWANRPDGICPAGAPLRAFNVVGLAVPITTTRSGQVDLNGALDVLAQDKEAIYSGTKIREPLAIRGNIGDCIALTYVSELTDGGEEVPYSKTNIHIHHVQFDTQASDGVISGFSFEQSIRPYKIVDPQLTASANPGDTVLHLSSVAKFQNGVWIAVGMGTEGIEIRQIAAIDNAASTVTLHKPLTNAHPADEWAGVEFVQYRWYPDVELDNVFFHDHVNGIFGWSHGMVGQLVIEPFGSTYHDPVTGAEIKSGAMADIHVSPTCAAGADTMNGCALIPGVIDGSFREFVLWTINDHDPVEATLNLRAEPWADRSSDPRLRFSSNSPQGDPFTPLFRAYVGDPVVIRNINVGQGTNVLHIDGHTTFWEPRYRDALGIESSPVDSLHTTVSEKFTLVLNGGAGGPKHVPGDYIYFSGENRRFESGAWGILRVLPGPVSDLMPLPGISSQPAQQPTCPAGAPVHRFNISAVDLPDTAAGGGEKGRELAFVPNVDVSAVLNGTKFPEPLVLHVAAGECVRVTLTNRRSSGSSRVSFHLGGLLRDMNSTGINVGFNPEQTVGRNGSRTYTFYADNPKLESVLISDFGGDNSGGDGLYGALVVAPAGATFKNPATGLPTDIGTQVNVFAPGQPPYRDFTLILADQDPRIGQNTMPYPAEVDGPALINYRTAGIRQDDANMFSSLTYGDPVTPLLRAYAGDPVKVHVLGAPASEQVHVFNLGGMSWPGDMYIHDASQWQSRAVGPWEKLDILISGGAGGVAQAPGDYFYGDIRRPFTQAGMWGLFRVLPNTCASGGTAGLLCLNQAAATPTPTASNTPLPTATTVPTSTPLPTATPVPTATAAPVLCNVAVAVPAMNRSFGYYYTFTTHGTGPIAAKWTLPTATNARLRIYAGNPFSGQPNPVKRSPPRGALAADSGTKTLLAATTPSVPAGQYTVYFFANRKAPAGSGLVQYAKLSCP